MRLTIVTDAWRPQINGVVRTIEHTKDELERMGVAVSLVTPEFFRTMPLPTYPEIRFSLALPGSCGKALAATHPTHVHIATEGPLGLGARHWCRRKRVPFTTSFHTRFPEYLAARTRIPVGWGYRLLRWFHNGGRACMVASEGLAAELAGRGFRNLAIWSRGIDADIFRPVDPVLDLPRPIFLNVGRVAVEKNIEAFLALDLPGTKVVVGDGPERAVLAARYPDVVFTGSKSGEALVELYASADVFVFPSRTDTFGNVILEALACGVPVAAYPVTGPRDIIGEDGPGALDEDLRHAALRALHIPRERCRAHALRYSWEASTRQFLDGILLVGRSLAAAAPSPSLLRRRIDAA